MLIDTSYFFGDLSIAQVETPAVKASVEELINKYEPKLLAGLLGYELYKAYKAGISEDPINAKWTSLRDGIEYTNRNGLLDKWEGLKRTVVVAVAASEDPVVEAVAGQYQSPIANFVYYWYMRANATTTAGSGEVQNNVAQPVSPNTKLCRAWNEMVRWNKELILYLESNRDLYTEYDGYVYTRRNLLTPINEYNF